MDNVKAQQALDWLLCDIYESPPAVRLRIVTDDTLPERHRADCCSLDCEGCSAIEGGENGQ